MALITALLSTEDRGVLTQALKILRSGGLVAFPTDTVYGVGCLAFDPVAIESLFKAKQRPIDKAIPVLIGEREDLTQVSEAVPPMAAILAARFWPGPLTLIVPKHPDLPNNLSGTPTVGVRVPDHTVARKLLQAVGPMAVTSANLSGHEPPRNAGQVMHQLNGRIHLVLDGGETPGSLPSTVVNCLGPEPVILRTGPISRKDLEFLAI